jgi:hypothetical protein
VTRLEGTCLQPHCCRESINIPLLFVPFPTRFFLQNIPVFLFLCLSRLYGSRDGWVTQRVPPKCKFETPNTRPFSQSICRHKSVSWPTLQPEHLSPDRVDAQRVHVFKCKCEFVPIGLYAAQFRSKQILYFQNALSPPIELLLSRVSDKQLLASGNSAYLQAQLTIERQRRRISEMEIQIRAHEMDVMTWKTRFTNTQ